MRNPIEDDLDELNKTIDKNRKEMIFQQKRSIDLNKEYRDGLRAYYYKISFFSVGAISLSITFLGMILSDSSELNIDVYSFLNEFLRLIDVLFLSWLSFVLAVVCSLLGIKFHLNHVNSEAYYVYSKSIKDYVENDFQILDIGVEEFAQENLTYKRDRLEKELLEWEKVVKRNKRSKNFNYILCRGLLVFSEYVFVVAVVLLSIFALILFWNK
jgi:hypothetical protein